MCRWKCPGGEHRETSLVCRGTQLFAHARTTGERGACRTAVWKVQLGAWLSLHVNCVCLFVLVKRE